MNTISQDRPTGAATRISRAIGAAALSTVLIAGLAGCMTGRVAATTENVKQNAPVPAGVDTRLPADLRLNVRNLTDEHYLNGTFQYGEPLTAILSLSLRF